MIRATSAAAATAYADKTVTVLPHTFNITFNANYTGAPGNTTQNGVTYGNAATKLSKNTFTRTNYEFSGWAETANGAVIAADEAFINTLNNNTEAKKPGGGVTLYAKWTTLLYTVKYNLNGGTVGSGGSADGYQEADWVRGGTAKALKKAADLKWTKAGYAFLGWATSGTGALAYTDGQSVQNLAAAGSTANLYALWSLIATSPPMGLPSAPEDPVYAVAVAAGAEHSLILKSDGTLWASGRNAFGELGLGDTVTRRKFTKVGGTGLVNGKKTVAFSAGYGMSVVITEDGAVWSTGLNSKGELGVGSTANKTGFTQTNITEGAIAVASGVFNTFVLKANGSLWATGLNDSGQLGAGNTTDKSAFAEVISSGVTAISRSGFQHALVIKNGTLWGAGSAKWMALGSGNKTSWTDSGIATTAIATGGHASYAVMGGKLYSTGDNSTGQLGINGWTSKTTWEWADVGNTRYFDGGENFACYINTEGSLWVTGDNNYGQLGTGSQNERTVFRETSNEGRSDVAAASAGSLHMLILKNNGKVYGTGRNDTGNLGNGGSSLTVVNWVAAQYDQ